MKVLVDALDFSPSLLMLLPVTLLRAPEFIRPGLHLFAFVASHVHSKQHHGVPSGSLFNLFSFLTKQWQSPFMRSVNLTAMEASLRWFSHPHLLPSQLGPNPFEARAQMTANLGPLQGLEIKHFPTGFPSNPLKSHNEIKLLLYLIKSDVQRNPTTI